MEIKDIRLKNCRELVTIVGSRARLAEKCDISITQLNHYIGIRPIRNIGERLARKIESCNKLETGWLDKEHSINEKKQKLIPLLDCVPFHVPSVNSFFANSGKLNIEEDDKKMFDEILKDEMDDIQLERKNAYWLRIKDDSMQPSLEPGTLTMIDKGKKEIKDGSRYALRIDGEVVLRRVYRNSNGEYKICSDKISQKEGITVKDFGGNIEVIGKMVFIAMSVD